MADGTFDNLTILKKAIFKDPNDGAGAEAYATVENGQVTSVTVTAGGTGYTAPVVNFIDEEGSGACATAVVEDGVVTAVNVTAGGQDYDEQNPPEVKIGGDYIENKVIMVEDPAHPCVYAPLLEISQGVSIKKDIMTYGGLFTASNPETGSGGGCIMMGGGFYGNDDPPCIVLPFYSLKEGWDTLNILKNDTAFANMKLGNLNCTGDIRCGDTLIAPQIRFSPTGSPVLSSDSGYLKIDGISGYVKITTGTYTYFISTAPYMFNNDTTINGNLNCTGDINSDDIDCNNLSCTGDVSCSGDVNCGSTVWAGGVYADGLLPYGPTKCIGYPWGGNWAFSVIDHMSYKTMGQYGCAKELSGQIIERKFQTVDDAISLIKHENNKEWRHIKYGEKEGTIVCTCGKVVDSTKHENICPEHKEEWEERYLLKTSDLIEASAKVIPHLLERIEELEKNLNKQT